MRFGQTYCLHLSQSDDAERGSRRPSFSRNDRLWRGEALFRHQGAPIRDLCGIRSVGPCSMKMRKSDDPPLRASKTARDGRCGAQDRKTQGDGSTQPHCRRLGVSIEDYQQAGAGRGQLYGCSVSIKWGSSEMIRVVGPCQRRAAGPFDSHQDAVFAVRLAAAIDVCPSVKKWCSAVLRRGHESARDRRVLEDRIARLPDSSQALVRLRRVSPEWAAK